MAHNVPRFIKHIKDRSGVSDEELRWLQSEEESLDYPSEVILRADEYLLYPKNEKIFMHGLFVLTLALAIMSFLPGGVRLFGIHFCSELEKFVEDEGKAWLHGSEIWQTSRIRERGTTLIPKWQK